MNTTVKLGLAILLAAVAGGSASSQTPRLNQVMRNKLDHSQKILEAVVTSQLARAGPSQPGIGSGRLRPRVVFLEDA